MKSTKTYLASSPLVSESASELYQKRPVEDIQVSDVLHSKIGVNEDLCDELLLVFLYVKDLQVRHLVNGVAQ